MKKEKKKMEVKKKLCEKNENKKKKNALFTLTAGACENIFT